jgi:AraC-like DNA-binding protein
MPKPKYLSLDYIPNNAVSVRYHEVSHFANPLHYHKELELSYIIEGYGTRYVGSSINPYKKGDLVLIGQELTHVWISDDAFYEENTDLLTKAIVIKFDIDFAGRDFFLLQEATAIKNILEEAGGGLRIKGSANRMICDMMQNMLQQSPLEQIISLIQILNVIAKSKDVHILSSYDFHKSKNVKEKHRMNKVVQYTMLQFKQNITLKEISQVANLSKSGFCRYFKNSMKKNYMEFLYEIRVQYACKLILENELGIMQISYEAGFNNPSAFSQIFKRIKGVSPNTYRKENSNRYL